MISGSGYIRNLESLLEWDSKFDLACVTFTRKGELEINIFKEKSNGNNW